jgi:tungstate transport system permease protein
MWKVKIMAWEIAEGIRKAFELILSGDSAVVDATFRSLYISGTATLLAVSWSIPLGILMGLENFRGKRLAKGFFNAMLGMPTVGLGLILYLFMSKTGPLGVFHLLYTPTAIIAGQAVLITPIAVTFTANAVESVEPEIKNLAKTLGASETEARLAVLREAIPSTFLAVIASFNRAIAELGVAFMLGGSVPRLTRVLTTSIALETTRGNFEIGIALTIILLTIVLSLSILVNLLKRK